MIPKIIHIVWVGDESLRPDNCINTWRDLNPGWTVRVWGNHEYNNTAWRNHKHMQEMWPVELNGVADIMRWEILHSHGGLAVDADSYCVRPLEPWLLEPEVWACWESEVGRAGLLAAGYVAAEPNNAFIGHIIDDIHQLATVTDNRAWITVGPARITNSWVKHRYNNLTVYPSHFFIPEHYTGLRYTGPGTVFARQLWGNTLDLYSTLHQRDLQQPVT